MGVQITEPVVRVVAAIDDSDTDAFVEAFTDDGPVDDWGRVLRGSDGVRGWAESDAIGAGARMTVVAAATEQNTTHLRFDWRSRVFNGESEAYVIVVDGKIVSFRIPRA
ncbi:nuclear transport factor 2 family protein [Nocardia sp. NPDC004568]|uniref:nuclear transport factor 2 family protein n=1 Tax=Nocardia sp. NPDC004568 TaxID=3154551 RepID=UPI0033A41075